MTAPTAPAPLRTGDFAAIRSVVAAEVGIDIPETKRPLVVARLGPRLRQLGLSTFGEYVQRLDDAVERRELVERITTHETRFFRDVEQYEFLGRHIERARASRSEAVRVWCAACSTGEEAYSVVMLALYTVGDDAVDVVATDVSRRVLEVARTAIYPAARSADVPPSIRDAYLLKGIREHQGMVRVAHDVRRRVRFAPFNLARDPARALEDLAPPPRGGAPGFDVVLLRNVVFYFDQATRQRVIATASQALRMGGLLLLGRAEASIPPAPDFRLVGPGSYRKEAP